MKTLKLKSMVFAVALVAVLMFGVPKASAQDCFSCHTTCTPPSQPAPTVPYEPVVIIVDGVVIVVESPHHGTPATGPTPVEPRRLDRKRK